MARWNVDQQSQNLADAPRLRNAHTCTRYASYSRTATARPSARPACW
jgi:hypothetical protein